MPDSDSRSAIILFRLAAALVVLMIALGAVWYGVSDEVWHRIWTDLLARPGGPMTFRFILQPAMAAVAALYRRHQGRAARPLTLSSGLSCMMRSARTRRVHEGLISTARIILLGIGMDAIYQYKVLNRFYPGEAVIDRAPAGGSSLLPAARPDCAHRASMECAPRVPISAASQ